MRPFLLTFTFRDGNFDAKFLQRPFLRGSSLLVLDTNWMRVSSANYPSQNWRWWFSLQLLYRLYNQYRRQYRSLHQDRLKTRTRWASGNSKCFVDSVRKSDVLLRITSMILRFSSRIVLYNLNSGWIPIISSPAYPSIPGLVAGKNAGKWQCFWVSFNRTFLNKTRHY